MNFRKETIPAKLASSDEPVYKKCKPSTSGFGNFSNWWIYDKENIFLNLFNEKYEDCIYRNKWKSWLNLGLIFICQLNYWHQLNYFPSTIYITQLLYLWFNNQ